MQPAHMLSFSPPHGRLFEAGTQTRKLNMWEHMPPYLITCSQQKFAWHISSYKSVHSFSSCAYREHDLLKFLFLPCLVYIMCSINAWWIELVLLRMQKKYWLYWLWGKTKIKQKSLVNSNSVNYQYMDTLKQGFSMTP